LKKKNKNNKKEITKPKDTIGRLGGGGGGI